MNVKLKVPKSRGDRTYKLTKILLKDYHVAPDAYFVSYRNPKMIAMTLEKI